MIDISKIKGKEENRGINEKGRLSAEEFNTLVSATEELQQQHTKLSTETVKGIKQGLTIYSPNEDGIVSLPMTGTSISLYTSDNTESYINTDGTVKLHLRVNSNNNGQLTIEPIEIAISVFENNEFVRKQVFNDYSTLSENTFTEYDITSSIAKDSSKRVMVTALGLTTGMSSSIIYDNITLTEITLKCITDTYVPLDPINADGKFKVTFTGTGMITKVLHIEITGTRGIYKHNQDLSNNATFSFSTDFTDPEDTGILDHGVHAVKAWISYIDSNNEEKNTEPIINRFMVLNQSASLEEKSKVFLLLQDINHNIENYVQSTLGTYAVFIPKIDENGIVSRNTDEGVSVPITFILSNRYSGSIDDDTATEYYRSIQSATATQLYTLSTTVEIESTASTPPQEYNIYLRAWLQEGDSYIDLLEQSNIDVQMIVVDNRNSFSPTVGTDFLINPKVRSNAEVDYQTIVNSINNQIIPSKWENFSGITDGWITDNTNPSNPQKVLRILAGQRLTIEYNPFKQFRTNPNSSMTLEFVYTVRNVTAPEDVQLIGLNEVTEIEREIDGQIQIITTMLGIRMNALRGYVLTKSASNEFQQDFLWEEDNRIHLAFNICHNINPNENRDIDDFIREYNNISSSSLSLCRVFMNGVSIREFIFDNSSTNFGEFCSGDLSNGGIVLGSTNADLDIYSIRCYENQALSAFDIVKNYIATLPTSAEKIAMREANSIYNESSNRITIDKSRQQGKKVLIRHGASMNYADNPGGVVGYLEIYQYKEDGSMDYELSGTIGKQAYEAWLATPPSQQGDIKALKFTRQGTTAKTYWYPNEQCKIKDLKYKINVLRRNFHDSISVGDPYTSDGKTVVDVSGGNVSGTYEYDIITDEVLGIQDGWFDGNNKYRGSGYKITSSAPLGQKMVNKINYASSMQSHLCGGTRAYNDLHNEVVGLNVLQQENPGAMVAKHTEPFLFFVQQEGKNETYMGCCTFGPGKMDDLTWGYDKKKYPHFVMLEGADNNMPLTDFRVPWDSTVQPIVEDGEVVGYAGQGVSGISTENPTGLVTSIDLDKFKAVDRAIGESEVEAPQWETEARFREIWNFVYMHNARALTPYEHTYEYLLTDLKADKTKAYWIAVDSPYGNNKNRRYCLYRFDYLQDTWVNYGYSFELGEDYQQISESYDEINLSTWEVTANAFNSTLAPNLLNNAFKTAILSHARANLSKYFKVDSLLFHYAFVNMFLAGTDNCSKNTYFVLTPKSTTANDKNRASNYLMELHQDDLDTIFAIDNTGRSTKPYYLDRINNTAEGSSEVLYEGQNNALFNLVEDLYMIPNAGTGEASVANMLGRIFDAMTRLVTSTDVLPYFDGTSATQTSIWGFLHKYFFNVQAYFPAVAWNEQSRVRYEYPASFGYTSEGRNIPPITQTLGNFLLAEIQYMKKRIVYLASYAGWGNFGGAGDGRLVGLKDVAGFGFQVNSSIVMGNSVPIKLTLTPYQYMYPSGYTGTTHVIDRNMRMIPGQTYEFNLGSVQGDTSWKLNAINYYTSIGNIGNIPAKINTEVTIDGKRLKDFTINQTQVFYDSEDNTKQITIFRSALKVGNAVNLQLLDVQGVKYFYGAFDIRSLTRLIELKAQGSSFTEIQFPETNSITTINLPSGLNTLSLSNMPNLNIFTIQGVGTLKTVNIGINMNKFNSYNFVNTILRPNANLNSLTIRGIDSTFWGSIIPAVTTYLASVPVCNLYGKATMATNQTFNFTQKKILVDKFGNIDKADNNFVLEYDKVPLTGIKISGNRYIKPVIEGSTEGSIILDLTPDVSNQNTLSEVIYSIDISETHPDFQNYTTDINTYNNNTSYSIYLNPKTGEIRCRNIKEDDLSGSYANETVTFDQVKIKVKTLVDGIEEGPTNTKVLYPVDRQARVGDFVYADGTWDSEYDGTKTVVGICFWSEIITKEDGSKYYDRRCIALDTISHYPWGLYLNNASEGFIGIDLSTDDITSAYNVPIDNITNKSVLTSYIAKEGNDYYYDEQNPYSNSLEGLYYGFKFPGGIPIESGTSGYLSRTHSTTAQAAGRFLIKESNFIDRGNGIWVKDGEATTCMPIGKHDTLEIIFHRNNILTAMSKKTTIPEEWSGGEEDSINDGANYEYDLASIFAIPGATATTSELTDVTNKLNNIIAWARDTLKDSNSSKYRQWYYPAASYCYAYEPIATKPGDTGLHSNFKAHQWYLPSIGELSRIYFYYYCNKQVDNNASQNIVINNEIKTINWYKYDYFRKALNSQVLKLIASNFWSSTEYSAIYSWSLNFNDGFLNSGNKYYSAYVRAVAAF